MTPSFDGLLSHACEGRERRVAGQGTRFASVMLEEEVCGPLNLARPVGKAGRREPCHPVGLRTDEQTGHRS